MQVFVIINNAGIKINADVSVKNLLTKKCVIKDLFGTLAILNVNVINHMILWCWRIFRLWKFVNVEKG